MSLAFLPMPRSCRLIRLGFGWYYWACSAQCLGFSFFEGYRKMFLLWSAHSRTMLGIGLRCPALTVMGAGGISLIEGDVFGRLTGI